MFSRHLTRCIPHGLTQCQRSFMKIGTNSFSFGTKRCYSKDEENGCNTDSDGNKKKWCISYKLDICDPSMEPPKQKNLTKISNMDRFNRKRLCASRKRCQKESSQAEKKNDEPCAMDEAKRKNEVEDREEQKCVEEQTEEVCKEMDGMSSKEKKDAQSVIECVTNTIEKSCTKKVAKDITYEEKNQNGTPCGKGDTKLAMKKKDACKKTEVKGKMDFKGLIKMCRMEKQRKKCDKKESQENNKNSPESDQ